MYENPVVQENLAKLRARGLRIIEPGSGFLACGYEGPGRLAEPGAIVAEVERALAPRDLTGERVLVSAGPTREPIDPVRYVSNRSSGKMGYALAAAAWRRGGDVVLVTGPSALEVPRGVRAVGVTTAAEMREAVLSEAGRSTLVLMAAAVADYRPARPAEQKLKKEASELVVECERTVDILSELGRRRGKCLLVGFAAETEDLVANAERKLQEKGLDLIVVNDVSRVDVGFDVDTNAVVLIDRLGSEEVALASKDEVAERILDRVVLLRSRAPRRKPALTRRRTRS
jgi:phosphopantothenoylcysteine decarboxylase / phosphopantothenate---cysteine ligase